MARECDYTIEAANHRRFRDLVGNDPNYVVPRLHDDLSTHRVITTEFVSGVPVDKLFDADEAVRNRVAELILRITTRELFEYRFMQTDPNFSNFLYDTRWCAASACSRRAAVRKSVDDYATGLPALRATAMASLKPRGQWGSSLAPRTRSC